MKSLDLAIVMLVYSEESIIKKYLGFKPKFNNLDNIIKSSVKWERKLLGTTLKV